MEGEHSMKGIHLWQSSSVRIRTTIYSNPVQLPLKTSIHFDPWKLSYPFRAGPRVWNFHVRPSGEGVHTLPPINSVPRHPRATPKKNERSSKNIQKAFLSLFSLRSIFRSQKVMESQISWNPIFSSKTSHYLRHYYSKEVAEIRTC